MSSIELYERLEDCCGCELCSNVCPVNIIEMQQDPEGFFYPVIRNEELCIRCYSCIRCCPVKNSKHQTENTGYVAGYSKNDDEIALSASGGLGTAISEKFLSEGAVFYGVRYSRDFTNVSFERTESTIDLCGYKSSKYVQARKNGMYNQIIKDLQTGNRVLVVGLPCEVAAVRMACNSYLDNLFLCDLICHGPTSLGVHQNYCQTINAGENSLEFFSVRHKKEGWKPPYVYAKFAGGKEFLQKFHTSFYGIAFRYMKRPSCNSCVFKGKKHVSDLTIGDFHYAHQGSPIYNRLGVSVGILHSGKGGELLRDLNNFFLSEVPEKQALMNEAFSISIPPKPNRRSFSRIYQKKGLKAACSIPSVQILDLLDHSYKRSMFFLSSVKKRFNGITTKD